MLKDFFSTSWLANHPCFLLYSSAFTGNGSQPPPPTPSLQPAPLGPAPSPQQQPLPRADCLLLVCSFVYPLKHQKETDVELGRLLKSEAQSVYNQLLLYLSVSYNKLCSGLAMLASKDETVRGGKGLDTTERLVMPTSLRTYDICQKCIISVYYLTRALWRFNARGNLKEHERNSLLKCSFKFPSALNLQKHADKCFSSFIRWCKHSYDQRPQSLRKAVITAHAYIFPFKREEALWERSSWVFTGFTRSKSELLRIVQVPWNSETVHFRHSPYRVLPAFFHDLAAFTSGQSCKSLSFSSQV